MRTIQRHLTSTYFVLIGCGQRELGRIVRELQFGRREHSRWNARVQKIFFRRSFGQFTRCERGLSRGSVTELTKAGGVWEPPGITAATDPVLPSARAPGPPERRRKFHIPDDESAGRIVGRRRAPVRSVECHETRNEP